MILLQRLQVENFKLLRRLDLSFPRRGSILIEGLNESGKSTLFESVYFALYGVPLVAEGRGRGNLDSVIRYGADAASVELAVEVDQTRLEIRRVVSRSRSTQAALVISRREAPEERVSGVQAVNARVVEELGGMDGDALLNSCFVEQKKLGKLEEMGAAQRRESLRRLLNLERLTVVADRFKVTAQDERALAAAKDRLDMAEVAAMLPKLADERRMLEAHLGGIRLAEGSVGERYATPSPNTVIRDVGATHASPLQELGSELPADPDDEQVESPVEMADRLESLRASLATTKRRVLLLSGLAFLALLLSALLAAVASVPWLWAPPTILLLVAVAILTNRRAAGADREIASLEFGLARHRDTLMARLGDLEGRRRRAMERLGGNEEELDPEECRRRVERLSRHLEVKWRAAALVEGTMERIVRLVLPKTERNLGLILPLLTAGRYHEARIGDDYQLRVWDDSAGRYVSKNIFSGGARDQISLALRLSFALATLPQELGATPGFLFLDEPLSSFDGPRTEALVRLLTSGQIAESFDQIFVISHNRSFDPGAFQHRLVLRDGRVVESTISNVVPGQE
ncbi:MAG TPA: AAA family ATPase [Chloroflexota bacterium]|nr:AAA family ATPase [Chloroflexota bacterium]